MMSSLVQTTLFQVLPRRHNPTGFSCDGCLRMLLSGVFIVAVGVANVVDAHQLKTFTGGVVAADHPAASEAGVEILQRGGNVVDAAVATSFALSVARPASCGIGGGGFMMIWDATSQKSIALDYRERAPAAASRDMFADDAANGAKEASSFRGGKSIAIPGTVAGLCFAAQNYGSLPLDTLLEPAIRLARKGVEIDEHDISVQRSTLAKFSRYRNYRQEYEALWKQYLNNGIVWKKGDRFHSPQLPTLLKIANKGPSGFYEGAVANAIVDTSKRCGGIMTTTDLRGTSPVVRRSLQTDFHGRLLVTMPPASSGGVALLETIKAIECWEDRTGQSLQQLGHNSAEYVHVVTEAMKHAFADRAEFLGDTDFVDVPVHRMISVDYAKKIAGTIDLRRTLPPESYGRFFATADAGTSHFSIIDKDGNAVACTETINLTYGSFVVVPEWGILLNNQIDDFAAQPGEPNAFGLLQSKANSIEPSKKPLSSMTPTIVVQNGKAVYANGASGGPRIISATIQSTLNYLLFDMSPDVAVTQARFHHQWFPNELRLETPLYNSIATQLLERGHTVIHSENLAAVQATSRSPAGLQGGSDPRKHGAPAGF